MIVIAWKLPMEDGAPMGHEVHLVEPSFKAAIRDFTYGAPDPDDYTAWEYVQVVDRNSLNSWWSGNDGSQGWRHKETGYTIPDYCRQVGGCPEIWTKVQMELSEPVIIAHGSPIIDYMKVH